MQKLLTKKLFFRKYPYKIELKCEGANYLRLRGIDFVIRACENNESLVGSRYSWRLTKDVDVVALCKFAKSIKPFLEKGLKHRAEGSHFNFFLEDKATLDQISTELKEFVEATWEPSSDEELAYLLDNKRKVIVEELPYSKFKHKIVFKTNWPVAKGTNFLDWLQKYPEEEYKISRSSYEYLSGKTRYCQDPFMYISEPKMLTMLQLFAGDHIKYAEEFVPRSTLLL